MIRFFKTNRAFTIVDLLILCSLVAILALVTIPNYLENRSRAKIVRSLKGLREVGNAYRAYRSDHGSWPLFSTDTYVDYTTVVGGAGRYIGQKLTTPIAYLEEVPIDPFNSAMNPKADWALKGKKCGAVTDIVKDWHNNPQFKAWFNEMKVLNGMFPVGFDWSLESAGPDLTWWSGVTATGPGSRNPNRFIYDPTNGTTSQGQLVYSSEGWIAPRRD